MYGQNSVSLLSWSAKGEYLSLISYYGIVSKFGLTAGQQKVVSTEVVVRGAIVGEWGG